MNTEKHAAEILLDRGVSWPLPAPWYLRILGKKEVKISMKALKLGTLLELSLRYAALGITEEDLRDPHVIIRNHLKPVCRIVAACILNNQVSIWLFSRPLGRFIKNRFSGNMLLEVMMFITTFSGLESFLDTIRLMSDLKITSPTNLSPESQGSQQK